MKEHKKLYKAGKNWVVATMAVASLGIVAMQQQVSADSTTTDTASATSENNSVQKAQQTKDRAQSAYDQQSQVVAKVSVDVSAAQSSADAADGKLAQAKTNAANIGATDKNIGSTSAAVNSQQALVDKYEQQLDEGTQAQPGKTEVNTPSATNAQALNESIEQNQVKLPDGYVKAFNEQIAAIGNQSKTMTNSDSDFEKSQNDIDTKEKTLQNIAKGLNALNPYHHNENDSKVAIKDIRNLDNDVATNLSLWYAGVLNNLVKKYDLRNVNGTLLRDIMNLKVTNYSLGTTKYINTEINKNQPISALGIAKSGAFAAETSLLEGEEPAGVWGEPQPHYDPRPSFLKAIDSASSSWGTSLAANTQKITNLDELKEATWNNLILYSLLDNVANYDYDNPESLTEIEIRKQDEYSSLTGTANGSSIFGPALFMKDFDGLLDTKAVNEYSFAIAVDKAGQITPHWYHVTAAYQSNKDNQPIQLKEAIKPHATSDNDNVAKLQEQYNQAKAKLSELQTKLAKLQQAANDVKVAQKNDDAAHAKLNAAKQKLQEEQAKLATLKAALDKATKELNVAKAQAKVNEAQAEYTKATNEYNAQKSVVNKDQSAVEAQQKVVNEKKSQLDAAKQALTKAAKAANVDIQQAQKQVSQEQVKVSQDNKDVEENTKKVNSAQAALNNAENNEQAKRIQSYINNDQNKLDQLQKQLAAANEKYSAAGFFKYIAENTTNTAQKQDAENAYQLMMGKPVTINNTLVRPASWYKDIAQYIALDNGKVNGQNIVRMPSSIIGMVDGNDNALETYINNRIRLYNLANTNNESWLKNYSDVVVNGKNDPFISLTAVAAAVLDADHQAITNQKNDNYYTNPDIFPSLFVNDYAGAELDEIKADGMFEGSTYKGNMPGATDIEKIFENKNNLNKKIADYINNQSTADEHFLGSIRPEDLTQKLMEINPYVKSIGAGMQDGYVNTNQTIGLSSLPGSYTYGDYMKLLKAYKNKVGASFAEVRGIVEHINSVKAEMQEYKNELAKIVPVELSNKLDQAKKELQASQDKLTKDTNALDEAKVTLQNTNKSASEKQAAIQQAKKVVADAQKDYETANQKLQDDQAILTKDQAKLAQLKQTMANKKQALNSAEKNLNDQNNSKQDTNNQVTSGNTTDNGQKPSTNVANGKTDTSSTTNTATQQTNGAATNQLVSAHENGKLVVNSAKANKVQNGLKNTVVPTSFVANHEVATHQPTQSMTNTQKLPQTGNNDSAVAGLLGAVLAMFGFGLLKKKHYEG